MNEEQEERLKEIINMANSLGWIAKRTKLEYKNNKSDSSYPPMQLSEVEKCMIAMIDDEYLNTMREWTEEDENKQDKGCIRLE